MLDTAARGVAEPAQEGGAAPAPASRRRFLATLSALGAAAIGLLVTVPAVGYVLDPLLRRRASGGRWFDVGAVVTLDDDAPVSLPVVGDRVDAWTRAPRQVLGNVWLQKRGEDALLALSAECPHLGCQVRYEGREGHFGCPCHNSVFDRDGAVLGGPAPRALDRLDARVVGERVRVRFLRYRAQSKEQIPIA